MEAGQAAARAPRAEADPIVFHVEIDANGDAAVPTSGVTSFVVGDKVQFTSNRDNTAIQFEEASPFDDADLTPGLAFEFGRRSRILTVTKNTNASCIFACGRIVNDEFVEWGGGGCHTPHGNCPPSPRRGR